MDEQRILSNLRRENPWWTGGQAIDDEDFYKRSQFHYLQRQVQEKEISGILGPRQVGKTTVMKQIIHSLLKDGTPEKKILYAELDSPYLRDAADRPINDVFQVYQELVLEEDFSRVDGSVYLFLDEIQAVEDWANKLKAWYGREYDLILIISGSSSAEITAGSESLLGRITERDMLPMKFSETIRMKSHFGEIQLDFDFGKNKSVMKNVFKKAAKSAGSEYLYKQFLKNSSFLSKNKPDFRSELWRYVRRGGMPRVVHRETEKGEDMDFAADRLGTDIEKAIKKDASDVFNVSPQVLLDIMLYIADNTAQRLVESKLADNTDVSRPTVQERLGDLEKARLIHKTSYYSDSQAASSRKKDKAYVVDPGYRNALIGSLGGGYDLTPEEEGRVVESIVANHVKRLSHNIGRSDEDVYFWYDSGEEVDLVLDLRSGPLPLEVKYRSEVSSSDLSGMNRFLYDFEADFGVVLSEDSLELIELSNGEVVVVPVWQFLSWI